MNNIEIDQLEKDVNKYRSQLTGEPKPEDVGSMSDNKLNALKIELERLKAKSGKSTKEMWDKKKLEQKVNPPKTPPPKYQKSKSPPPPITPTKKVEIHGDRKPKIVFISDVKGWAWWIKSQYLKKHLSDEFEITVKCVLGPGCQPQQQINSNDFDLYFTFGFSYIDKFHKIPRSKKVTGVTAHRRKQVILPKMKMAGHVHANSKMLLNELVDMGFKKAYYVPNGVDEELFTPVKPVGQSKELIVGHVGKECPAKGQKQYIIPAIQSAKAKSFTNMVTWKNQRPHNEMPEVYQNMDVMVIASHEDGTPNPALEAAACGRPIISNNIGNMPEFIIDGYNGFLVERKIGAYVNKIRYFQENRQELKRMGENARKTVEESWTWKKQAENYRNMFRDIFVRR